MADRTSSSEHQIVVTLREAESLAEALRALNVQYSGRYVFNGGASARQGRSFVDLASGQSTAALQNPIYRLEQPVYLQDASPIAARADDEVRFTLCIDIDGNDPLNVVSATVAVGPSIPGSVSPHFIGQVTSDTAAAAGRLLRVENFRFQWPGTSHAITRLDIELAGSALSRPTAHVTFRDIALNQTYGPYAVSQQSPFFREVEVDVDREANAVPVEPVSTLVHPEHPTDLPAEELTLERAFAKAGLRITRSNDSPEPVGGAGADNRWNEMELHDSMTRHWEVFANKPQWKMWIFLAERAEDDGLGGVMFDGEINEPGGVDRQGTAIFTRCPYFHTVQGRYIRSNPPEEEAVKRELFFNLVHETGHAFNLAHSFQKKEGAGWTPPAWMPLKNNSQALSWMNYPDSATPGGNAGANATWFYSRFRFQFDRDELLFLRHAPETYVEMGAQAWFEQHGRAARADLDRRLEFTVRSRKEVLELGEPVMIELKVRNLSDQPVLVHQNLDPSDGLVEIAVTNPKGERRPVLMLDHTRRHLATLQLQPKESIYGLADLTMGSLGFPFKEPGAYRIEATYTNVDGRAAAAVMRVYVAPPSHYDALSTIHDLFDARVGRVMYVEGTRVLEDVNDKLVSVGKKLDEKLGRENPISIHLATVRYKPLERSSKVVDPMSNKVQRMAERPDEAARALEPVLLEKPDRAADTLGHIWYRQCVDSLTSAAEAAGEYDKARKAQDTLLRLAKARAFAPAVVQEIEERGRRVRSRPSAQKPPTPAVEPSAAPASRPSRDEELVRGHEGESDQTPRPQD